MKFLLPEDDFRGRNIFMKYTKKYVGINARFDTAGNIIPLYILWEDGRKFPIDRVKDVRPCASLKCGGFGIRYTCSICGHEIYLFLDGNRWFVEKRK